MSCPSNALDSLASIYGAPPDDSCEPYWIIRKYVEVEVLSRQSDLQQPAQEITDQFRVCGFI